MKPQAKAIFLDKDGTLIDNVLHNVDPGRIKLSRHTVSGLRLFRHLGYRLLLVSNQPGVALGYFEAGALEGVVRRLDQLLRAENLPPLDGCYFCPHDTGGRVVEYAQSCLCRKPQPGLLLRAASDHGIDLSASWMVGDILHDVEAGQRAGCKTVLIDNGNETEWDMSPLRMPHLTAPDLLSAAQMIAAAQRKRQHHLQGVQR